jgi:selenocysteine lyase/cysteine desulfurase
MENTRIYLDYNATTPIHPEVAAVMKPYIQDYYGNPSSAHWFGVQTKLAVEKARKQIATFLNCSMDVRVPEDVGARVLLKGGPLQLIHDPLQGR